MIRFFTMPSVIDWVFPGTLWRKKTAEKVLYLTFDDGPIPEVTEFVLHQLEEYYAKATFFCVGENVVRHRPLAERIHAHGHRLANHTFHHLKAWQHPPHVYLQNAEACQVVLDSVVGSTAETKLFRPPHGQLTRSLLRKLTPRYQVVLWSSLSYDFDATLPPEDCLRQTVNAIRPGSIVVLHDSLKAERNLRFVLPRLLRHFSNLGYTFQTL